MQLIIGEEYELQLSDLGPGTTYISGMAGVDASKESRAGSGEWVSGICVSFGGSDCGERGVGGMRGDIWLGGGGGDWGGGDYGNGGVCGGGD
ncbi:glycine-rich protein 2-like [Hevea brasiliensis]|uniref:glycine-rich protein 2-like n=1 Tax=Hevea brasiliensis TaxID=3981 RepID=UPI0025EA429B|nr:glycine-rich protein 2-like [Hevea brasiliensis]